MLAKSGIECAERRMGARTLARQLLFQLDLVPVGYFRPTLSCRIRCFEILVNRALRDRTTTGDLSLFPSQGMESEDLLDFSHGQPFLGQRWVPPGTQRAIGLSSAATPSYLTWFLHHPRLDHFPDRHQFGILIGMTSEP
jgi:hypothetical protein